MRRFATINDQRELEETIRWVRTLRVREETITMGMPLIKAMRISGRWPGIGMYGCVCCNETMKSARALTLHLNNQHAHKCTNFRWQEQVEYAMNKKLRWKCEGQGIRQYKRIANCPHYGCSYAGMIQEALTSHMSQVHQDLLELANEIGLLYAMITIDARNFEEIPSTEKLIMPTTGAVCKRCYWFVGRDRQSVAQHARKSHQGTKIEGSPTESVRVSITPEWFENDDDSVRNADRLLEEDEERRANMRIDRLHAEPRDQIRCSDHEEQKQLVSKDGREWRAFQRTREDAQT